MISYVLSSSFEPLHIYHGYCHTQPSTMFFACRTSQYLGGVCWSLSWIQVWGWRHSSLAWVPRRLLCIPCKQVLWRRGQHVACIYTSWIPTMMVLESATQHCALTSVVLWSHWIYFPSFWSRTSWQKIVTTTKGPTWIAYGLLGALPCVAVSSSEKSDEIPIAHRQIWLFPYQICQSWKEV